VRRHFADLSLPKTSSADFAAEKRIMIEADGGRCKIALGIRWGPFSLARTTESRKRCPSPSVEYFAAESSEEAAIIRR
jgi:hypothetical protein